LQVSYGSEQTKHLYQTELGETVNNNKTIFSTIGNPYNLEDRLLMEIAKRGGSIHIGTKRSPGQDRDVFRQMARIFGISNSQQQETNRHGKNKWDYTVGQSLQRLNDPARAGSKRNHNLALVFTPNKGFRQLTDRGLAKAKELLAEFDRGAQN
jgi:hypothetical protein